MIKTLIITLTMFVASVSMCHAWGNVTDTMHYTHTYSMGASYVREFVPLSAPEKICVSVGSESITCFDKPSVVKARENKRNNLILELIETIKQK